MIPVNICLMGLAGGDVVASTTFAAQVSTSVLAQAVPVPTPPQTPAQAALQATPLAQFWTFNGAISELGTLSALQFVNDLKANPALSFPSVFDIVNTHFHLDREPARLAANLHRLRDVFGLIKRTLDGASTFFQNGPVRADSPFADAPMGGFQLPGTPFNRVTFRPGFVGCGPNTQSAMIVHECAHFVGGLNVIDHFAMEFPVPQGQPQGRGHTRDYQHLLTSEALRNASSYAAYAIHAATLQDSRFGARDITL
jgi:hypothetical protein